MRRRPRPEAVLSRAPMEDQLVVRHSVDTAHICQRTKRSSLIQSAPCFIAVGVAAECTAGEHSFPFVTPVDCEAEALKLSASAQCCRWRVVDEDALICLSARRNQDAILIHGPGVAALGVLQ